MCLKLPLIWTSTFERCEGDDSEEAKKQNESKQLKKKQGLREKWKGKRSTKVKYGKKE
jgi:hypothetical protein